MSSEPRTLKPLPLPLALLYFGIPAFVFVLSVYYLIPFLMGRGFTEFMSYGLSLLIPLILMLIASLIALKMEGYPITWGSTKERFRLRKMDRADWVWTGISLLIMFTAAGIFGILGQLLVVHKIIPLPAHIPTALLDPTVDPKNLLNVFYAALGPNIKNNWWLVIFSLILLFFNIIGEEFWWRGVILPRQELVHGKWTWLIHGTLGISYVAQKRKNTWPGIINHFVIDGSSPFPIIAAILK